MSNGRPLGVTLMALLQILTAIVLLLGAIGSFLVLGYIEIEGMDKLTQEIGEEVPDVIIENASVWFTAFGIILLIIALFWFAVAYGFIKGRGWAWTTAMVLGILTIITQLIQPLTNRTWTAVADAIVAIIIPLIILFYLTRPRVKAWFGKM